MKVDFLEDGHVYAINGEIARLSVTELLQKHGLAPDYSKADKKKLKESAERGKEIHKDLENILNQKKYTPTTKEGRQFKDWVLMNLDSGVGEQMLGFEHEGLLIAGTADFMGTLKDGSCVIGDHKTTSKFHREYVTWQVSLLDYFARRLGSELLNGKSFGGWKGALKFYCFHYAPDLTIYELEKIPDSEIEKLLDCELHGEIYKRPNLVIDKSLEEKFLIAEQKLALIEEQQRQAKKEAEIARAEILKAFKEQSIYSWESPNKKVKVTYIAPVDTIKVDEKKLMAEYPFIYAKCQITSQRKEHIRITVRKDGDCEL